MADKEDKSRTYYICRTTPISGFPNLASYLAPVGRLASLDVGSEFTLPNGKVVEVIERAQFKPVRPASLVDGWDARDTTIKKARHFGPVTIESLRALLEGGERTENVLKPNIIEGVRRGAITKMELRDQPILDQYQDEIFRLPLDKRLLLLGPPGAGKTTTLIRRLGQKLDTAFLAESEQGQVNDVDNTHGVTHANSWLMFTPTELLKQYLKEAFVREGVLGSVDIRDSRGGGNVIQTSFRGSLACAKSDLF